MIKKLIVAASAFSFLVISASPAEARINQRQTKQQVRIAKGVTNGGLTANEAARLQRQQVHIARYEARSRADGPGLTRAERVRIEAMQDGASRNIRHQKHDRQGRRVWR